MWGKLQNEFMHELTGKQKVGLQYVSGYVSGIHGKPSFDLPSDVSTEEISIVVLAPTKT